MYIYVLHFRGSRWSEKKAMLVSALDKSSSMTRVDVTWHDNDMIWKWRNATRTNQ